MRPDRNHEGYHDPTASKAIKRTDRGRKEAVIYRGLTYPLREARGFQEAYGDIVTRM